MWPWEDGTNSLAMAKQRMMANIEFLEKLGVDKWCFHDRDIAPDAETLEVHHQPQSVVRNRERGAG
ncbi:hypothetical protein M8C21_021063 [Ambrosia artemisiifolia]|uniref:xylose isomerase n=1 Tax=Ambrosia artemisiifolia TaxID=4212 RepID=A0AAD5BMF2_AMBAR|nr:hypothetical protein M8C21_021063 [Ambrosia artemisiifolia]